MKLEARIPPGSLPARTGYRLLMAAGAARLAPAGDAGSRAVGAALATMATGRMPPEERAWAARIEAQRRRSPATVLAHSHDTRGLDRDEWLEEAAAATRWMSLPDQLGQLLMRIVREVRPDSCLELGTGFGFSTAYQAAALELGGAGAITSLDIEGMTAIAGPNLTALGLDHRTSLVAGRIEETLEPTLASIAPVDYALLDADHTGQATRQVFESVLAAAADRAVIVLDDVNWTEEMREAWQAIRACPAVAASVTLRRLGIIVTRKGHPR